MNTLEVLLSKRWIVKEENRELYYKTRDHLGEIKRFITEKLGYPIISNQYLIRLEKIPAKPEAWMGIAEFTDRIEYAFLCMVLMFLEDKDSGEQFILSQLTEYIQVQYQNETIDWTQYHYRRHLIRVMKFCIETYMLRVNDGSEENFASDYQGDVLYENTGISRYFMKNFPQDISDYDTPADFLTGEWIGMNEDRGVIRRQRVYRSLLMNAGLYKTEETDEDFAYVKNYRNMIGEDFSTVLNCELQVHKTSAYLILGEDCDLGKGFPEENSLSDIILLCNHILLERIRENRISVPADEMIVMDDLDFQSMIEECKSRFGGGLVKLYRDKTTGEFVKTVVNYLEELEWIAVDCIAHKVTLKPIMGKVIGRYPKTFNGGAADEQQMAGK